MWPTCCAVLLTWETPRINSWFPSKTAATTLLNGKSLALRQPTCGSLFPHHSVTAQQSRSREWTLIIMLPSMSCQVVSKPASPMLSIVAISRPTNWPILTMLTRGRFMPGLSPSPRALATRLSRVGWAKKSATTDPPQSISQMPGSRSRRTVDLGLPCPISLRACLLRLKAFLNPIILSIFSSLSICT